LRPRTPQVSHGAANMSRRRSNIVRHEVAGWTTHRLVLDELQARAVSLLSKDECVYLLRCGFPSLTMNEVM
jgi:hypothetical protein